MGIHNVDEILWLTGRLPERACVLGSNLHSHRLTTCTEDFDDAILLLDFGTDAEGRGLLAEVQVSRNHVSGYRGETVLYGEEGQVRVGRFSANPREVVVEAFGSRESMEPPVTRTFPTRAYDQPLPEFADRFGDAYKDELRTFVECCREGRKFPTTHRDALRAQEVIEGAMSCVLTGRDMAHIAYS